MLRNFMIVGFMLLPVWTSAAPTPQCPVSWQYSGSHCFKVFFGKTKYNCHRANLACQNEGGWLASIHSFEELEFLRDKLEPPGLFYISLKENSERDLMKIDGTSYNYSNWNTGEPTEHTNCVILNTSTFKWFAETCNTTVNGALCSQKPLGKYHRCVRCKRKEKSLLEMKCSDIEITVSETDEFISISFRDPHTPNGVNITYQSHHSGDLFPVGVTDVTYNFTDGSGNSGSCTFTITVQRVPELPDILQYLKHNKGNLTLGYVVKASEWLDKFSSSTYELNENQVEDIANILSLISGANISSPQVTSFVLEVTDNITTAEEYKGNVISANSSQIILTSFERQLDNALRNGRNFSETGRNIAVELVHVKNFETPIFFETFAREEINETYDFGGLENILLFDDSHIEYNEAVVTIQLDPKAFMDSMPQGQETIPLSFVVYRSDALFQDPQTENSSLEVNSYIISASTTVPINNLPTESSIKTTFRPKNESLNGDVQCVFWNHTLHGRIGGWSREGCYIQEIDTTEFISCYCNHLTSFAILVSPHGDVESEFTRILTPIGCAVSIIFLALTILSIYGTPKIRSKVPQKINVHLFFALLGLYLFFLIGVNRTDLGIGCVIFGALIHFFLLASIAWMSVEATNMYLMFVKVFNADVRQLLWKASAFAWGFPLVVVLASAVSSSDSYSHGEYCFPHHTTLVFCISVLPIVALLLMYNLIMFFLIIWKLTCARKNIASSSITKGETIHRLINAIAISILLGTMWIFGLLPIKDGDTRIIFSIFYNLFTSFQGLLIFLLLGVRRKEVRMTWKRWLCILKRGEESTQTTGLSGHTNQGQFVNNKETPELDPKTENSNDSFEIKEL